MTSVVEMAEFIFLWDLVTQVTLEGGQDTIAWKWTANGEYSSKSAYLAQFNGSYSSFDASALWKASAEGKHKFFAWLLVQSKLLMADRLTVRNWPCNPTCPLCDFSLETAKHLCLHCSFAQEVWDKVSSWTGSLIAMPDLNVGVEKWCNRELTGLQKNTRRIKVALMMYTAWNIWKERNRRIFEGKRLCSLQVFFLIKEEMVLRKQACGGLETLQFNVN